MIKKLISLILAISCFPVFSAFAAEYTVGEQKNFDAYALTNMAECFKYSTLYGMSNTGGYFGNTSGGGVIVYKNMDFGRKGAVNVELTYACGTNYGGTLQFRKNSPTGEIIAEVKSSISGSWQTQKTTTTEVEFPTVASGRFDLYVVLSSETFGNLYSFKFNETPTAYQTINAISSLKDYIGFTDDDFDTEYVLVDFDNSQLLGDDYARHLDYYVSFENKTSQNLVIDANVTTGGRMRIYDNCPDGELLQEVTLAKGNGVQTFIASDSIKALSATKNLCFAFDNNVNLQFKSFGFTADEKINFEETVFNTSNNTQSAESTAVENSDHFSAMDKTGAFILWEDVDFGAGGWPVKVTASYGVGAVNYLSDITLRLDSPTGDIIAKVPAKLKYPGGWNTPNQNTSLLLTDVSGVHDLYVTVENSEHMVGSKGANIYSITFEPVNDAKYAFVYDTFGKYHLYNAGADTMLSFKNDEDNPDEFIYSLALYDNEGVLLSVDSQEETATTGLNTYERTVNTPQAIGQYSVKAYIWDIAQRPVFESDTYTIVVNSLE